MGNSVTISKAEAIMKKKAKCMCGESADLKYIAKLGRINNTLITVNNVPVYVCNNCNENFMNGSDSLRFSERVRYAFDNNKDEIEF